MTYRRMAAAVLVFCVPAALAAQDAGILKVIPEKTLVAVMTKDATAAEAHLRALAQKLDADLPKTPLLALIAEAFDVDDVAAVARSATVDLKAPLAVVMLTPAMDLDGEPIGIVMKVADYKKFLHELAGLADAVRPEVTRDGTDIVDGAKNSFFAARLGPFAVVAEAEYVIKTFKAEAKKSLAVSGMTSLTKAYAGCDVACYLNLDEAMRWLRPMMGVIDDPETKLGMDVFAQIDAVCAGVTTGAEGATAVVTMHATPKSSFARLANALEPGKPDLATFFDAPGILALAWDVGPAFREAFLKVRRDVITSQAHVKQAYERANLLRAFEETQEKGTGKGALAWQVPKEGEGFVRMVFFERVKPGAKFSANYKKRLLAPIRVPDPTTGSMEMDIRIVERAETHRKTAIDKLSVTFSRHARAPGPDVAQDDAVALLRMIMGPEMRMYLARSGDVQLGTLGFADSGEIKTQIDRLLDARRGRIAVSPVFREAMRNLPESCTVRAAGSLAEVLRAGFPVFMDAQFPGVGREIRKVRFEKPSAAGVTIGPARQGLVLHLNVPVQEMKNTWKIFKATTESIEKHLREQIAEIHERNADLNRDLADAKRKYEALHAEKERIIADLKRDLDASGAELDKLEAKRKKLEAESNGARPGE